MSFAARPLAFLAMATLALSSVAVAPSPAQLIARDTDRHPEDSLRLPCLLQPNAKTIDMTRRRSYRACSAGGSLDTPEQTARHFLEQYSPALKMGAEGVAGLRTVQIKRGLASAHTRFEQTVNRRPVFNAWLSVHQGPSGDVQALHTNYSVAPISKPRRPKVRRAAARRAALAAAGVTAERMRHDHRLVWFAAADGTLRVAHELWIWAAEPLGDFLTVVDGVTGKILFQENRIAFDTGSGLVFLPNPVQTSGNTGLTDNSDLTSPTLDAQRSAVTLLGLDAGTGRIKGEYVDLTLTGGLVVTVADEPSRVYNYDRDDDRFEEVTIYHSIDSLQRWFHSLGFDDDTPPANGIRDFPTLANAHWFADDQSYYSTGDDAVHFGDGGIDDGEDADIIAHEYGHAVQHDQNACWGGGDMGAMGEGFGDYLAASFYLPNGDATYQASHAACVGDWDATSFGSGNPACLRRVDGNKTYPGDLVGSAHADGEIWSRAVWDIRLALGATKADTLVLEHHFSVPCNATMTDAALALLQANVNLYSGLDDATIRTAFCDRGILSGVACTPPSTLSVGIVPSDDPAFAGSALNYTVTATNTGGSSLTGVALSATVPSGSSYIAGSASDGGSESGGTVSWSTFSLAAGAQAQRSYQVLVGPGSGTQVAFSDDMESGSGAWVAGHNLGSADWSLSGSNPFGGKGSSKSVPTTTVGATACIDGKADVFSCNSVDLEQFFPMSAIGGGDGNDSWGWTDSTTGSEYAIAGRSTGTSFLDVTDPAAPIYLGDLPTATGESAWRDMKVYADHVYIVSDNNGAHGMQVFDLTGLRSVASPPVTFSETAHYPNFGNAHNIAINEDTGFAYVVGSSTCSAGLHMVDLSSPASPVQAGCYSGDGYTHDVQCVVYAGPDSAYSGQEICFAFNEDTLTIVNVEDKSSPVQISRTGYSGVSYTHQGWVTEDHAYVLLNDELDEAYGGHNTRTYIVDVSDLDAPVFGASYTSHLPSIDHNLYIKNGYAYESNYTTGLRIIDLSDIANGNLCEVASFDIYPASDAAAFAGAWNVYPFFASGTIVISSIEGLTLVTPDLSSPTCFDPGGGSGQSWFAPDPGIESDLWVRTASPIAVAGTPTLTFWHDYNTEPGYDGGVVEISSDGGSSWSDLGSAMTANGYNSSLNTCCSNPLGGRQAFSGSSGEYLQTTIDLSAWTGEQVLLRWRMGSDSSVPGTGWYLDNVEIGTEVSLSASAQGSSNEGQSGSQAVVTQVTSSCGNGVTDPGEDCDDSGESATCDADCTAATCGDQAVNSTAGEQCDDGNLDDTDACLSTCLDATCGDSAVQAGVEECDDGPANSDTNPDACRTDCSSASCGDNVQDSGEDCDDGGESATCDGDCTAATCGDQAVNSTAGEQCDDGNLDDTDACLSTCLDATCGDSAVQAGVEECDDGPANSDSTPDACRTDCSSASCGDSVQDSGEQCDDGNSSNTDACTANCLEAFCGDGYTEQGVESCDDGNNTPGDGCSDECAAEVAPDKAQQACIVLVNKAASKVAKARGKIAKGCMKTAAKGDTAGAQACITTDPKGKVAKARQKLSDTVLGKCQSPPSFGFTDAATAGDGAEDGELSLVAGLLGNDLSSAALTTAENRDGARCQATVQFSASKLSFSVHKLFQACKKSGLKAGSFTGSEQLAGCFDVLATDSSGKLARARNKTSSKMRKNCTSVDVSQTLPGSCSASPDGTAAADCAVEVTLCKTCLELNVIDDMAYDCDQFDNGLADGSCN